MKIIHVRNGEIETVTSKVWGITLFEGTPLQISVSFNKKLKGMI